MRYGAMAAAIAAAVLGLGGPAAAQPGNTAGLVDLPGMAPKETSPLKRLSRNARSWIADQEVHQAQAPRPLIEIVVELEYEIGDDILRVAKRERIDTHDLIMVVLFDIVRGADERIGAELRRLEAARAPADKVQDAARRKVQTQAMLAEVVSGQSVVARQLSGNL